MEAVLTAVVTLKVVKKVKWSTRKRACKHKYGRGSKP
jgi:hypothetical protein